ncbi:unnamed protein product [Haemonchus placei]|uniref:SKA2 domain-containing protein n=1 Tax=Haemonchus placei TaxID=6290 RepID=A0A0N4WWU1_HAEPC|nr:unnamed protein product [Haemonchus placei]
MKLESLRAEFHDEAQNAYLERLRQLEEAMGDIDVLVGQLEPTLSRFLPLRDSSVTGAEPDDNETYSIRTEDGIAAAVEYIMLLQARIRAIKSCDGMGQSQVTAPQPPRGTQAQLRRPQSVELPTLPIPKFNENIWDWDKSRELYNANMHLQDLPEPYKFNYLLDALQGEARESIRKFQVTKANYSQAITFLHNRYGSGKELVQKLIKKLEMSHLRSQAMKEQRSLSEQIKVIIQQLRQKGEQMTING